MKSSFIYFPNSISLISAGSIALLVRSTTRKQTKLVQFTSKEYYSVYTVIGSGIVILTGGKILNLHYNVKQFTDAKHSNLKCIKYHSIVVNC